jgi:hypothetical protein
MLVGAGDGDGVSHDQLAAIGREYSTLVKKRAENKDGQRSTGLGSDPHAEPAEHRPGAVVIETIVLEDKYRVILTTPEVQIPGDYTISREALRKKAFEFRDAIDA